MSPLRAGETVPAWPEYRPSCADCGGELDKASAESGFTICARCRADYVDEAIDIALEP